MSEISNADIYNVLLELKGEIGELKGTMTSSNRAFSEHLLTDAAMAKDINSLQMNAARQRGIMAALTTVGTVLGAVIGYAIDAFALRGH